MKSVTKSPTPNRTFTSSIFINVGGSLARSVTDDQNNTDFQVDPVSKKLIKDKKSGKEKEKVPEFIVKPRRQFVNEGQTAKFKASYDGSPETKLTWSRTEGDNLSSGGKYKIYEEGEFHWLEVRDVTSEDSGSYTCTILNSAGSNKAIADLDVYVKPQAPSKKSGFVAPKVDIPLNDLVVSPGDKNVTLECKFSNAIDASSSWYKDGRLLTSSFLAKQSFDGRLARLVLTRVASKDSGKYQCVVTNTGGEAKTSASLTVSTAGTRAIPPKFVNPLSDQSLRAGDKLVLEAKVTGYPRPTVHWFKEKEEIKSTEAQTMEFDGSTVRLVMSSVQVTDSATYKCVAENEAGKDQIKAKITVTATKDKSTDDFREPPTFVKELHDMEVDNGDRVELSVEVKGMTPLYVIWLHDDKEVAKNDPYIRLVSHGNTHELHIPQAIGADSGEYICEIQNEFGSVETICNLHVTECKIDNQTKDEKLFNMKTTTSEQILNNTIEHMNNDDKQHCEQSEHIKKNSGKEETWSDFNEEDFKPPQFLLRPRTAFVEVGKSAIFLCRTAGVPPPSVEWSREGEIIPNKGRYKISNGEDCILEIKCVLESDVGVYTCTLTNPCGMTNIDTRLVLRTQDVLKHTETRGQTKFDHVLKKSPHHLHSDVRTSPVVQKDTKVKPDFVNVRLRKTDKPESKLLESKKTVSDTTLPPFTLKHHKTSEQSPLSSRHEKTTSEFPFSLKQHKQSEDSSESDSSSDRGSKRGTRAGASPSRLNFPSSNSKFVQDKKDNSSANPKKSGVNQIDFRDVLKTRTRHQVSAPVKESVTRTVAKPTERPITSSITNDKSPVTLNGTDSATKFIPQRKSSKGKVSQYITALEKPPIQQNVETVRAKITVTKIEEPIKSKLTSDRIDEPIKSKLTSDKSEEPIKSKLTSDRTVEPIKSKLTSDRTVEPIKSKLTSDRTVEPIKSKLTFDKTEEPTKSRLTSKRMEEPIKSKVKPHDAIEPIQSKFTRSRLEKPILNEITQDIKSTENISPALKKNPPPVPPKTKREERINKKLDEINELSQSILSMPGGPPMKELLSMVEDVENASVTTEDSFADSESSQTGSSVPAWVKDHFDTTTSIRNTPSSGFSSIKSNNSSENCLESWPSESDDSTVQSETNDSGIVRATPAVPYTPITLKNPVKKSHDDQSSNKTCEKLKKSENTSVVPVVDKATKLEFEGPKSTIFEKPVSISNRVNSRKMSTESEEQTTQSETRSKRIHNPPDKLPISPEYKERRLLRSSSVDKVSNQLPTFLSTLEDKNIPEGRCVTFECQVTGIPRPEVSWFMNNNKIKPSKFFQMTYAEDTARLVIKGAYPEDDGEYLCVASNCVGTERQSCFLHVKECSAFSTEEEYASSETTGQQAPHIHEISPPNLTVLRGKKAQVQVSFTADPKPNITWLQNKKIVSTTDKCTINTTEHFSRLTIYDAELSDGGIYDIDVENDVGRDTGSMAITVEDVPDPPTGKPYASEIALEYIILSWSGPAYDGGSLITNYKVDMCEAVDQVWKTLTEKCHSTSYHAANLLAHTPYFFRVSAENKHGMSQPSETSDVIVTKDRRASNRLSIESDEVFLSSTSTASVSPFTPLSPQEEEPEIPFSPRVVTVQTDTAFEDMYELKNEVGKGKFGNVYICVGKDDDPDKKWAAKVIKCRGKDKTNVKQEIEIMNKLTHPKLLMLRDAFETARKIILVMEYVGGGELFERVVDEDFELTERDCVHFLRQICEGVEYMHGKSIIHLDLKPENILCVRKDSNLIKIIDFGLAQYHTPGESLRTICGTPEFIAPEVVNYEEIGFQTDVWSLGVICYVLLSGLSPFMGDSDVETLSNVTRGDFDFDDEAFEDISFHAKDFIEKTLHLNRKKRPNIHDCLKHKWLVREQNSAKKLRQSLRNLKQFMARRKWQKMGTAIRALGRMSRKGDRRSSESSVFSDSDTASQCDFSSQPSRSRSSSKLEDKQETHKQMVAIDTTTNKENVFNTKQLDKPTPANENKDISPETDYCNNCIKDQGQTNDLQTESTSSISRTLSAQSDNDTSENMSLQFVREMVDSHAFTGDVVRFDVTVSGDPEPDIQWFQEDLEIVEDERHSFVISDNGDCSLIIKNVSEDDDGEFTCKASNCFGEIMCSADLIICGTGAF